MSTPPDTARTPTVAELVLPMSAPPLAIDTELDDSGLARLLAHTEAVWERLGREEPHWSVISAEQFKQATLSQHRQSFYDSGAHDVAVFQAFLQRNGVDPARIRHVIEFGCGVGRVTRHLAAAYPSVLGMDISSSHLALARQHLADSGVGNATLQRLAGLSEIGGAADADAIFSVIVLQHNPPPIIAAVLNRLLQRLRPGGVAYFQVPTYGAGYRFDVADYLARGLDATHIEMHYLPQRHVFAIARRNDCDVLEVREDDWTGNRQRELSNTFLLQRR